MMRRLPLIVCFALFGAEGCAAQQVPASAQPEAFEEAERWGFRVGTRVVISPRFHMALDYLTSGIAPVVDDSGWVYIDTSGRAVIRPYVLDNAPDPFAGGLARFTRDGKMGYFDVKGNVVITPKFDYATPFSEGLAAVCNGCTRSFDGEHSSVSGGSWGYIDRDGCAVTPMIYEGAESVTGRKVRVKLDGEWVAIRRPGPCRSR